MNDVLGWSLSGLPEGKPGTLLGIGTIKDIFIGTENGIDTFDCVIPTREARHGAPLFQRRQVGYPERSFCQRQ